MPSLSICGGDLVVLIERLDLSNLTGLTFIIDVVDKITVTGGNKAMQSPAPIGTSITDHIVREPDKIRVSGMLGCLSCSSTRPVLQLVLPLLKRASSTMIYVTEFFTVTSNTFIATNMVLTNWSVNHEQSTTQKLDINLEFEAANIAGEISAPSYQAGGILGF